jgi:hypothetical protein
MVAVSPTEREMFDGGELRAGGYTIPSRIEAGWSLGEADEFRFFEATLDRAEFR